ncbi:hypothetical protein [Billgrantia desiderata]|uniref:hypothetical protein n=1 Tax=Billgrantia desiderata TaxID=52021 RepID=UPI0011238765|nr:hypothetical protein [Halomonas desiderata]
MGVGLIERLLNDSVLVKVSKIRGGSNAVCQNFPDAPGVYIIYKDIERRSSCSPFVHLMEEIESDKFTSREGVVAPLFNIRVESRTRLPKKKIEALKEFSRNEKFVKEVDEILSLSILFQSPLYVGKANNIRARLRQHLDGDSDLKETLSESGIDIRKTNVLAIMSEGESYEKEEKATGVEYENLIEDLLSRMFCPGFTRRYG